MDARTKIIADTLAGVDDLEAVVALLAREQLIRETVAASGEERRHVEDMLDAMISMGEEAVLDLTEGNPTTLRAGLQRYVDELKGRDELEPRDHVVDDLETLLAYPWPIASAGPGLEVERPDDETSIVKVGGQLVAGANYDDHGWAGMDLLETTARNVYNAAVGG